MRASVTVSIAAETIGTSSTIVRVKRVAVETAQHHYSQAIATAERALAIYGNTKGGLIQSQLGMRFWRAFSLFELHRDDEALREVLDIEPKYRALFPRGALGP